MLLFGDFSLDKEKMRVRIWLVPSVVVEKKQDTICGALGHSKEDPGWMVRGPLEMIEPDGSGALRGALSLGQAPTLPERG